MNDHKDLIARANAAIAEHERSVTEAGGFIVSRGLMPDLTAALSEALARAEKAEAALANAVAILGPFADVADECDDNDLDDDMQAPITAGDCRHVRFILKELVK